MLSFTLTENEQKRLDEFKKQIKDLYGKSGQFIYTFAPTGIGTVITVHSCLAHLDREISDVGEW